MKPILPVLLKDFYKVGHKAQYPKDTTLVYSNFTPRSSRVEGVNKVVAFGYQYFVLEYLLNQFGENFFARPRADVVKEYKRRVDNALGPGTDVSHIGELHEMGFLPVHMKAVPEGLLVPLRVPALTIRNTDPKFFWLTNMLETLLSNILWLPTTSATTAFRYRKVFKEYARETGADEAFVPWQGHDFSFRGMAGIEAAVLSGAAHLLSFTGTDTIPAIDFLEEYYGANSDTELIGGSVPATEHSVMCMGMQKGEFETFRRLITEVYPKGIVSIVSDTWDFWSVLTDFLPKLKSEIMSREGKVVIRPDSGDPVKIICGDPEAESGLLKMGAVAWLWYVFGGTMTSAGYKVLDPHIGLIYGDSITPERQVEILERLKGKGFASSNVVLGIGSYTYQHVTRDTYGWAMKATYGETQSGGGQAIFKDPKTDNGIKKSAKGLLQVKEQPLYKDLGGQWPECVGTEIVCMEDVDWSTEATGVLQTIFRNGIPFNIQKLSQIRARIEGQL